MANIAIISKTPDSHLLENIPTTIFQWRGISIWEKNELLFSMGVNYNDLPSWQKRGVGMFFKDVERRGFNPITKETVPCIRRELYLEEELPLGEAYSDFIKGIIRNY